MPKQKRWQLKRSLEQAVNDLDRCQKNLITVAAQFDGVHPEFYKALSIQVQGLELSKGFINQIKDAV